MNSSAPPCKSGPAPCLSTPKRENMKTKSKSCRNCTNQFNAPVREIKRGNGNFCSISCALKYRQKNKSKKKPNVECAYCSKAFYKTPSSMKISKSGLFFCCRGHKDRSQRIGGIKEIMPPHYGNGSGVHTYRRLAFDNLPHECANCGWDEVPKILEVHHKDEDRSNNDLSNLLIVCPTCHCVGHYLTKSGKWSSKL